MIECPVNVLVADNKMLDGLVSVSETVVGQTFCKAIIVGTPQGKTKVAFTDGEFVTFTVEALKACPVVALLEDAEFMGLMNKILPALNKACPNGLNRDANNGLDNQRLLHLGRVTDKLTTVLAAAEVIALTTKTHDWLRANDPKALDQLENAIHYGGQE